MSGSTIGTFAGAAIGFMVGGPAGAQVGAMAGGMLGATFDTVHTPGPRLGDLPLQTSQEGAPRPIIYGTPQPFFGNIMQAGEPVKVVVEIDQGGGKGGPKQTTDQERAYQTVAIRICEGNENLKLLRFWVAGKLAYSAFGEGIEADSATAATKFTFYAGGEEQMPDPSLEALPAEHGGGVGNVPAYRGTCYIVFDNFDITDFGGFPPIQFQVSASATVTTTCPDNPIFWYPLDDAIDGGVARELIVGADGIYSGATAGPPLSINGTGSAYFGDFGTYMVYENDEDGLIPKFGDLDAWTVTCWCRPTDVDAGSVFKAAVWGASGDWTLGTADWLLGLGVSDELMQPFGAISYSTGFSKVNVDPTVRNVNANLYMAMTWVADTPGSTNGTRSLYINGRLVSQSTGEEGRRPTRNSEFILAGGGYAFPSSYQFLGYVADLKGYDYCLTQEDITNRYLGIDGDVWENPDAPGTYMRYDGEAIRPCGESAETDTVTLASIVEDIARRAGVDASQLDLTPDESVEVDGYLIGRQMTAQSALSPLALAYFRDYPEYDLQIHSVPRGGSVVATLTDDDFLEGDDDELSLQQKIELPRKINVAYSDPDANYARRIQMAERESINIPSTGEMEVELALVLDANAAAQKAEIMLKVATEESLGTLKRRLPAYKHADLVVTDRLGYDSKEWRIDRLEWMDGEIVIEAKRDRISNYVSAAVGGVALDPTAPVSSAKGPSILQAMNLPRLTTAEQEPGMYLAVTGLTNSWPGALIYVSVDGGATYQLRTTISKRATMGRLTADVAASGEPISVLVYNQRVLSTIESGDTEHNGIAITTDGESEIKQFLTATDNGSDTWDLSDVSHGMLETDDVEHNEGDAWVLLDDAIVFLPIDAAHAGKTLYFRAVTRGTPVENNDIVTAVFDPQFTGPATVSFLQTISGDYAETIGGSRIEAISQ